MKENWLRALEKKKSSLSSPKNLLNFLSVSHSQQHRKIGNFVKYSHTNNYQTNWRKFDFHPRVRFSSRCFCSTVVVADADDDNDAGNVEGIWNSHTLQKSTWIIYYVTTVMLHAIKYLLIVLLFPTSLKSIKNFMMMMNIFETWIEWSSSNSSKCLLLSRFSPSRI